MKPNNELKVLITGGDGLLGTYLYKCLLDSEINCLSLGRKDLDITSLKNIDQTLLSYRANVIVNCAAYTNVEKAEIDNEACYSVNVSGVINLIQKSNEYNCKLIQISSDFVFDGTKESGIYFENDIPNPINYYGLTKYIAEKEVINNASNWIIVRTAWLYGNGSSNFVNKIIDLSKKIDTIYVTDNEIGSPTYVLDLAKSIKLLIESHETGIFHITNSGSSSRFEFATEILATINSKCNVLKTQKGIEPIRNNINTASRPKVVVLKSIKSSTLIRHWRTALLEFLSSYQN